MEIIIKRNILVRQAGMHVYNELLYSGAAKVEGREGGDRSPMFLSVYYSFRFVQMR
jgi:hypothetical protein